jgi:hypothetical protein
VDVFLSLDVTALALQVSGGSSEEPYAVGRAAAWRWAAYVLAWPGSRLVARR